jgi:hypothetical protein
MPTHYRDHPALEGISDPALLEILRSMKDMQADMHARLLAVEAAFPANDAAGHRRYHELMIEDIESRKKLVNALKEKTLGGILWTFIAGSAIALYHEFIKRP